MDYVLIALFWLAGAGLIYLFWRRTELRWRSRARLQEEPQQQTGLETIPLPEEQGPLTRWLFRAGFRQPGAAWVFVAATVLAVAVGGGITTLVLTSDLVAIAARGAEGIPGGVGDIALPVIYLAPWLFLVISSCSPWLLVRAVRRRRLARVQEDLPLMLDLLATLGQAGLGFDAALERVLSALRADRPLTQEWRTFQVEVLGGRGRIASLRRLSRRVDFLPLTTFISALVQTEQSGAGISDVLRRQAEDQRNRRREQATAAAMSLPVKMLFPLIICFLPGLFVATLGPTFYQFFQAADAIIRNRKLLP